jgi:hypothetical protein
MTTSSATIPVAGLLGPTMASGFDDDVLLICYVAVNMLIFVMLCIWIVLE